MGYKAHAPRVCPRVLVSAVCSDINCGAAGVRAMIYIAAGYCYSGKYYYGVGGGVQISTEYIGMG